jgi:hypothetical protein
MADQKAFRLSTGEMTEREDMSVRLRGDNNTVVVRPLLLALLLSTSTYLLAQALYVENCHLYI